MSVAGGDPGRRAVLAGIAGAAVAGALDAAPAALPPAWPSGHQVPLWPGSPPGAGAAHPTPSLEDKSADPAKPFRLLKGIATPVMEVHRPARPNGTAVLLIPGGAYSIVAYDVEGLELARWSTARGVTAFILFYRLPAEGWTPRGLAPLQDAQRALRLIRARANAYAIDPKRVIALGFSAGGHLCGSLATRHAERTYARVDAADDLSCRPDLAALLYPVVSLMPPLGHAFSAVNLLGEHAAAAALQAASVDQRVTRTAPPLFIAHAADDDAVDPGNSLLLETAARHAGVPSELHVFAKGGHGFGLRLPPDNPGSAWPDLLLRYAAAHGIVAQPRRPS